MLKKKKCRNLHQKARSLSWLTWLNALEVAVDVPPAVVESFRAIIAEPNVGTETSRKANGLLHAMTSFDFRMALVATMKIFGYTHAALQSASKA